MEIDEHLNFSSSAEMGEAVSFNIWAAAATCTRAFKKVEIKIHPPTQRIFVAIFLRWWASTMTERIKASWLVRAEDRIAHYVPAGWSAIVYYKK